MNDIIKPQTTNLKPRSARGFTLVEILVVIGIVVILLSILIPVVSKVRKSAQVAAVQSQLKLLAGAIQNYERDHGALPGPLPYNEIYISPFPGTAITIDPGAGAKGFSPTFDPTKITMAENFVLGLAGGLKVIPGSSPTAMQYDPSLVGTGASGLNPANPKKGPAYIDATNLSWRQDATGKTGKYQDNAGIADDSAIPEILDTFPSPMPILILRARTGQQPPGGALTSINNHVITEGLTNVAERVGQYDLSQIIAYTAPDTNGNYIGESKDIDVNDYKPTPPTSSGQLPHGLRDVQDNLTASMLKAPPAGFQYVYPYDAFAYLKEPTSPDTSPAPRQKNGYILISAGLDRIYGTPDDITNFGEVTAE